MQFSRMLKTASLALAIASLVSPAAMAQDDVRNQHDEGHQHADKKAKVVELFPDATRPEPGMGPTADMVDPINQLLALVNGNKNNDEAIATGEKLAANKKANHFDLALVYQALGFANLNKGDGAKGLEDLQKSLDQNALSNNEQYQLMLQLAKAQIAFGQPDAGLATLARVVTETKQDKPEYNGIRGRVYYVKKDYANAALALQKSMDGSAKPDPDEQRMLMASYVEIKQPERAEKIGEDILQAHPDEKTAIMNLATIYQQIGQDEKARALLEDAHKRGMLTSADDYRELYALYSNLKGHENDSVAVINEGLQKGILQPNAEVYNILAQDYYFTNQTPQAIEAYKKADEISTDGEAALDLAKIYNNEGKMADAKAAAERALQKGVKHPDEAHGIIDRAGGAGKKPTKKK